MLPTVLLSIYRMDIFGALILFPSPKVRNFLSCISYWFALMTYWGLRNSQFRCAFCQLIYSVLIILNHYGILFCKYDFLLYCMWDMLMRPVNASLCHYIPRPIDPPKKGKWKKVLVTWQASANWGHGSEAPFMSHPDMGQVLCTPPGKKKKTQGPPPDRCVLSEWVLLFRFTFLPVSLQRFIWGLVFMQRINV